MVELDFSPELVKMNKEEEAKLDLVFRDLDNELKTIFAHDFKILTRSNAEQFFKEISNVLKIIGNHIREYDFEVDKFLTMKDQYVKIGTEHGGYEGDPFFKALNVALEALNRMVASTTYRAYMIDVLKVERSRTFELFKEIKNIEVEKIKMDTTQALYDNLMKKQMEFLDKQDEKFGRLETKYSNLLTEERVERERERQFISILLKKFPKTELKITEPKAEKQEEAKGIPPASPADTREDIIDIDAERNFECEYCYKLFSDDDTLRLHIREKHKK